MISLKCILAKFDGKVHSVTCYMGEIHKVFFREWQALRVVPAQGERHLTLQSRCTSGGDQIELIQRSVVAEIISALRRKLISLECRDGNLLHSCNYTSFQAFLSWNVVVPFFPFLDCNVSEGVSVPLQQISQ